MHVEESANAQTINVGNGKNTLDNLPNADGAGGRNTAARSVPANPFDVRETNIDTGMPKRVLEYA